MGYYTRHELTVSEGLIQEHVEQISLISGDGQDLFDGETVKWYSHEKDMRAHSINWPELMFTLEGEGEEAGDIWVEYYKNGKMQRCSAKITFDAFDDSKLS